MWWRQLVCIVLFVLAAPGNARAILIDNVSVIDVARGEVRADRAVLIRGGQIAAVGEAGTLAPDGAARVVDGAGGYLIPGLWDMHVHTSSDETTRAVLFPLFLAHGVIGVRDLLGDCLAPCWELSSSLADARRREADIAAGLLAGPRVVGGSVFANGKADNPAAATDTPERARQFVRLAAARGARFIKPYDLIPRDAYLALVDEARSLGLPVYGHVPVAVSASEGVRLGQDSIEHLGGGNYLEACSAREDILRPQVVRQALSEEPRLFPLIEALVESTDPARCAAAIDLLARSDTWLTPTLVLYRLPGEMGAGAWHGDPMAAYLHPGERAYWHRAKATFDLVQGSDEQRRGYNLWVRETARRMHAAGVKMLAGSDAGAPGVFWGQALHQELEMLVSIGLSPAEALRSATLGPAEFLGEAGVAGRIAPGMRADLVLLDENPLADIRNTRRIRAVIARGRLFDRAELDALLARARAFVARADAAAGGE